MKRISMLIAGIMVIGLPQTTLAQSRPATNATMAVKITEAPLQAESQKLLNQLTE
jgi:hypothetical protein